MCYNDFIKYLKKRYAILKNIKSYSIVITITQNNSLCLNFDLQSCDVNTIAKCAKQSIKRETSLWSEIQKPLQLCFSELAEQANYGKILLTTYKMLQFDDYFVVIHILGEVKKLTGPNESVENLRGENILEKRKMQTMQVNAEVKKLKSALDTQLYVFYEKTLPDLRLSDMYRNAFNERFKDALSNGRATLVDYYSLEFDDFIISVQMYIDRTTCYKDGTTLIRPYLYNVRKKDDKDEAQRMRISRFRQETESKVKNMDTKTKREFLDFLTNVNDVLSKEIV